MSKIQQYIHGYSPLEQQRLIAQAKYWREGVILPDLPYQSGDSLLDIGCGAGAVLGEIGMACDGLSLYGVDLSSEQVGVAERHLKGLGLHAEFYQANATTLPFTDNSIDHVYMMWFLEHLNNPVEILREALRVLKPGGTITTNETDYTSLIFAPETANTQHLIAAFCQLFDQSGHTVTGPKVSSWMSEAGFSYVQARTINWYFGGPKNTDNDFTSCSDLNRHAEYMLGFIEPSLEDMAQLQDYSRIDIEQGIADVRKVGGLSSGKIGLQVWRHRATKLK